MAFKKSLVLAGTALTGAAFMALMPAAVMAQSTATEEVEVIIKGGRKGVGPINRETGAKTKSAVDQQYISTVSTGQTVTEILNLAPGFNFTNNDPYGSSGGNLRLRGLDGSRVSLTVDGIQLNDAGNYAIYTNQQMDSELIQSATIVTGATDVDSMTASATGGTISYTTRRPSDDFGFEGNVSAGSFSYSRQFIMLNTGKVGPFGTKAYIAYSNQHYDTFTTELPVDNGKLRKRQFNANVHQDLDNGSYFGVRAHHNVNRNRFIFGRNKAQFEADPYSNTASLNNVNPSNTGNIRGYSKWVINDKFYVTVDPAYQYVLANGGGGSSINEATGVAGSYKYIQFEGVDLNGDGVLGTVRTYRPNTTQTDRFSISSSAVYTFNRGDILRAGVSLDRARTRQTGEATLLSDPLDSGSAPIDVFGGKLKPELSLYGKDGSEWQRRNRFSKANVDALSLEYRSWYFDEALFVTLGIKNQKLTRELNQYCYSRDNATGGSNPFCTSETPSVTNADGTVSFASNPGMNFIKPYSATVSFSKTLPHLGATYRVGNSGQFYANYSESMSSPRTDNYYSAIIVDGQIRAANPNPETNKTVELGYRFATPTISASATVWQSKYDDRILSTYDQASDTYFDRNVGRVDFGGFEGSFAWAPSSKLSLFTNLTYTQTEILDDYQSGSTSTVNVKGKSLPEVPEWMVSGGLFYTPNDKVQVSLFGKYVGERFATDLNDAVVPSYLTWNGSLRYNIEAMGKGSYVQLNIINLFDEEYYGSISPNVSGNNSNLQMGAPRTVQVTLYGKF